MHDDRKCSQCETIHHRWSNCPQCEQVRQLVTAALTYTNRLVAGPPARCDMCAHRGPMTWDMHGVNLTCRKRSPIGDHKWPRVAWHDICGRYKKGDRHGTR